MNVFVPDIPKASQVPERPGLFLGPDYYHSLASHAERNRLGDRLLTTHLGSTALGVLVEKTVPGELATRLNALTPLKLAYAVRSWQTTRKRLQLEREYKSTWSEFQSNFIQFAKDKQEFRLLQIGAYDGVTNDRMHPLIIEHPEWDAVLVEPMPEAFAKLGQTYSGRLNTRLINSAIGDMEGPTEMYQITPTEKTPLFIDLTATTNPKTLDLFREAGAETKSITVHGTTLPNLLSNVSLKAEDIDLLFIDAEGCDYTILRQLLSSESNLPSFIVAEHDHMSDADYYEVVENLYKRNYRVRCIAHDLLAEKY